VPLVDIPFYVFSMTTINISPFHLNWLWAHKSTCESCERVLLTHVLCQACVHSLWRHCCMAFCLHLKHSPSNQWTPIQVIVCIVNGDIAAWPSVCIVCGDIAAWPSVCIVCGDIAAWPSVCISSIHPLTNGQQSPGLVRTIFF